MSTGQCFLTFLITKTSSDKFGVETFAKMLSYFDIVTVPTILILGSLSLISLLESIYVFVLHQQVSF